MTQRRNFLKSLAGASLGFVGIASISEARPLACEITTPDVQVPFYIAGSPERYLIALMDEPGSRLIVSGKVTGQDCQTPLANAKIEVWQASSIGVYDQSSNFKLRGFVQTNENGLYSYETIYPASYDGRPSHIHYRVSASNYTTLVTQLYFQGDPLIANDPFASPASAKSRIVPVQTNGTMQSCVFDIALANTITGVQKPADLGYLVLAGSNPFSTKTQLSFSINMDCEVLLAIFDSSGRLVKELIHQEMAKDRVTVNWDGSSEDGAECPNGLYTAVLYSNHEKINHVKLVLQR